MKENNLCCIMFFISSSSLSNDVRLHFNVKRFKCLNEEIRLDYFGIKVGSISTTLIRISNLVPAYISIHSMIKC